MRKLCAHLLTARIWEVGVRYISKPDTSNVYYSRTTSELHPKQDIPTAAKQALISAYRVLHKNLQSRIPENLFVPAKHPIKATQVWPVTFTCASFSFSSFCCTVSWLTSPRSVAPVDYSFAQLLVNLRRHDRDMSHFGRFARMFGRDKQMFCDSRLQFLCRTL